MSSIGGLSMDQNMLVFDVGTQSIRGSVIDPKGTTLLFARDKYETPYISPVPGEAEKDIEYYVKEICKVSKTLKEKDTAIFSTIGGVSVVDIRDSSVILDENKKPIRNAILWLDDRSVDLKGKNFSLFEKFLFRIIGMYEVVSKNADRTAFWWIKEHEPENFAKMRWYCPLGAYFNYRITGNLVSSSADCIGHFPTDFKHGNWFPKGHPKYDVFGVPKKDLVPLVKPGSIIGRVSKEFALESMIPEGTPLFACASDKACETLGNGVIDKNEASISLGTACTIDVVDSRYSEPEAFLPSYKAPYEGAYDLELQVYSGLWLVTWYVNEFGTEKDQEEARKKKLSLEEFLDQKIEEIPAGSDGLVVQPYWYPALEKPDSRGAMIGFTSLHTRYHVYRAILEGICYCLRAGLDDIVKKTKKMPSCLIISGGGSNQDVLPKMISDVFNLPVRRAFEPEASSLGGAMAGYLAMGYYKTPEEAKANMVRKGNLYYPNPKNAASYDQLYRKVYKKMYPSLKNCYLASKQFYLQERDGKK